MGKSRRSKFTSVGPNMREIRMELGLSLRDVAIALGIDHALVYRYERAGFVEPPWSRFAELYRDHPDLRGAAMPALELNKPDLFLKSRLHLTLMGMYGREKLTGILEKKTNRQVLEEVAEQKKEYCWKESDVDCIRVRIGVRPVKRAGNPNFKKREKKK